MQRVRIIVGPIILIFGLLCLNYTKAVAWEHHQRQAVAYGFPPPSTGILWLGAGSIATGSGLLGAAWGRRKARRAGA